MTIWAKMEWTVVLMLIELMSLTTQPSKIFNYGQEQTRHWTTVRYRQEWERMEGMDKNGQEMDKNGQE